MLRSIPKVWAILAVAAVIAAIAVGGFLKSRDKQESDPVEVMHAKLGVIDMDKAIKAHPEYSKWVILKQEEMALLQDFENSQKSMAIQREKAGTYPKDSVMGDSAGSLFEQEFNAKMKVKQDELQEEISAKAQIIKKPLDEQFEAYVQQLEEEYQPQIFDLHLKLSILQVNEEQAKSIGEKIEQLKMEQNAKLQAKSQELSQKLNELMEPEMKKINDELERYASQISAEINVKEQSLLAESPQNLRENLPEGLRKAEEKIVGKRQEADDIYKSIEQKIRYKAIEVAIKQELDTLVRDYRTNVNTFDITDLVIAEFKK